MFGRDGLRPGMMVVTLDGHKLGKIQEVGAETFTIEKGMLFKKEYLAQYSLVSDVRGDEVILSKRYDEIGKEPAGVSATRQGTEDIRVPIAHEELDVLKREREAGSVRVTKDVITEQKSVTVPVAKEEVRVERVPVEGGQAAAGTEIGRDEVTIPVHEEEIEVRKRPVVREEVRLHKERSEEPRVVADSVRREEVDIESTGDVNKDPRFRRS